MGLDKCKGSVEVLDSSVHEVIDENLSNFVEGVGDVGTSREVSKDLGSNKELNETAEEVKVQEKRDELPVVDQGTSYSSSNLVNHGVVETVVVIDAVNVQTEGMKLETKADESGLSLVSMKAPKGVCETDKDSCVIDMKCSSHKGFYDVSQGEKICRICHLTFGQSSDETSVENGSATSGDFIQLGCSCKDELGIAHMHCAEVWFKLKGNRLCEICGETAKNVSVISNNGFMEGWNDRRFMDNDANSSQQRFGGCWRGQPFCNFLMACLVIAFILPWFFHVSMF